MKKSPGLPSQTGLEALTLTYLDEPTVQRILITGERDLLNHYMKNLTEEDIPSVLVPLVDGRVGLEVWYNRAVFTKKLDEIAGKTVAEIHMGDR